MMEWLGRIAEYQEQWRPLVDFRRNQLLGLIHESVAPNFEDLRVDLIRVQESLPVTFKPHALDLCRQELFEIDLAAELNRIYRSIS
jgi:hypothetical protein